MKECRRTCKGRVVYDRKKHAFTFRDAARIGKRTGLRVFEVSQDRAGEVFAAIDEVLQRKENEYEFSEINFGGGQFGGSGATRSWSRGLGYVTDGIMILIEGRVFQEE